MCVLLKINQDARIKNKNKKQIKYLKFMNPVWDIKKIMLGCKDLWEAVKNYMAIIIVY